MSDNDVIGGGYYCNITDKAVKACPYATNPNFNYTDCRDCGTKPEIADLPTIARQAVITKKRLEDILSAVREYSHRDELMTILLECDEKLQEYEEKILKSFKK